MKAMKNRSLLVVALVLVLTLSVGLTLAYFSDLSVAKGGKSIVLKGSTEIEEEQPSNDKKIVRIVNTGDTPVMVRVAVYAPGEGATGSGTDWEKSGDYYYYKKVIPAKAGEDSKSTPLEVTWKVPEDLGDDYSVVVAQESEMVVYDKDGNVVKPETDPAWAVLPAAQ